MARLALPVVADQIGLMSMSFVDTIMVARLGSAELGAVGIGATVYFFFILFAFGVLASVTPTVAQAFGAGRHDEIETAVGQSFWLVLALTALGLAIAWNIGPVLRAFHEPPKLIALAETFVRPLSLGVLANLMYTALRGFVTGLGRTRVTMVISLCALVVNAVLDYALIYGNLGAPRLGVAGAGYATAIVQTCMFLMLAFIVLRAGEFRRYRFVRNIFPIRPAVFLRLARLGLPIGAGNCLEGGIFGLTALLMGQIGQTELASHQIALNVASFTFMIPLGIGTAITTRVGQFIGLGNRAAARTAGWVGIGMAAATMCAAAALFLSIPGVIVGIYTDKTDVVAYATGLLMIAGAFQLFDGIQVATLGALRGLKDTSRPMFVNLFSYWCVGVPTGYALAFWCGLGGHGLWWGLVSGLAAASVLHTLRFRRLMRT